MNLNFPAHYNVLLVGPPGVGKFDFLLNYAADLLKSGDKVVFLTTDKPLEYIEDRIRILGAPLGERYGKSFAFIDCYSANCGKPDQRWFCLSSLSNLEDLSLGIARTSQRLGLPVRILFDSLSSFYLHNSATTMASFFQIVARRVKSDYGFAMYTLEEGMHDRQTEATLYHLVDGVLEMSFDEKMGKQIRAHHMTGMPALVPTWVKATFDEDGRIVLHGKLF